MSAIQSEIGESWARLQESPHCWVSCYGRLYRETHQILMKGKNGREWISTVPGKFISGPKLSTKGYKRVTLQGKQHHVHSLVAKYFVANPMNKPQINHKDGNKLNNRADNLEWVTNYENRRHAVETGLHRGPDRKVSSEVEQEILQLYLSGLTQKQIGDQYRITQQLVSKTINRLLTV